MELSRYNETMGLGLYDIGYGTDTVRFFKIVQKAMV